MRSPGERQLTTLLRVRHPSTERELARCDGRCYEATSAPRTCRCACGGANHGVGLEEASANARHFRERGRLPIGTRRELLRSLGIADLYQPRHLVLEFAPIPVQLPLFGR